MLATWRNNSNQTANDCNKRAAEVNRTDGDVENGSACNGECFYVVGT